jgi:hypothetical protein
VAVKVNLQIQPSEVFSKVVVNDFLVFGVDHFAILKNVLVIFHNNVIRLQSIVPIEMSSVRQGECIFDVG